VLKKFLGSLKIVLPIGLAIFLFWKTFKDPELREQLAIAFSEVNWFYIALCLFVVFLSHISRAYRWKYLLQPLGYETKFSNAFFSLMIGYVMNMLIPRAGEISRAAFFSRFEKVSTEKVFGTIAAERVVDLIMLATITFITFFIERETALEPAKKLINDFLVRNSGIVNSPWPWLILAVGIIGMIFVLRKPVVREKIMGIVRGLKDGLLSIIHSQNKWQFLFHTLFIWTCYIVMFYIPFKSLASTSAIEFNAVMVAFVFGAFSVVLTPGGSGSYHYAVGFGLAFYGFNVDVGTALGLIIWVAQTVFYIVGGLSSLYLINKFNENYLGHTPANQP